MRLIDADKIDFGKVFIGASDFAKDTREAAQNLIENKPTVYDVDKVVEQINAIGKSFFDNVKCDKNCHDCEHCCIMRAVTEKVKEGGVFL